MLAQITLYGLSMSPGADSRLVEDHWGDLWAAASTAGSPCRCERDDGQCRPPGEAEDGCDVSEEAVDADAIREEEDNPLPVGITDEQLLVSRQVLSERSEELGRVLEETLDKVRAGRAVPELLTVQLEEWQQARSRIANQLADNGREWSGSAGFAELDEIVQELRETAAERAEELRRLGEDRDGLRVLLERTAPDAPHRIPLQESLTVLEARIGELVTAGSPRAAVPPDEPLPCAVPEQARAIDPGVGAEPLGEPEPVPTAGSEPCTRRGPGAGRRGRGIDRSSRPGRALDGAARTRSGSAHRVGHEPLPEGRARHGIRTLLPLGAGGGIRTFPGDGKRPDARSGGRSASGSGGRNRPPAGMDPRGGLRRCEGHGQSELPSLEAAAGPW
ncbi:hypothetical protein ACFVIY_27310 [Streptomyces sp. NPDC127166]|uniref:hypothetical protein n=1 Tax=Streptomyces sp. NPDC127166 TaxID=3345380 RepID=UPI0036387FE8